MIFSLLRVDRINQHFICLNYIVILTVTPPSPPDVTVTDTQALTVTVSWTQVTDAVSYEIKSKIMIQFQ